MDSKDCLTLGVIALVIGIPITFMGFIVMSDYQTDLGQMARAIDEDAESEYQSSVGAFCCGSLIVLTAIVLIIYGFYNKGDTKSTYQQPQYPQQQYTYQQQYQQPQYQQPYQQPPKAQPIQQSYETPAQQIQKRYCGYCGKQIIGNYSFCPFCGGKTANLGE